MTYKVEKGWWLQTDIAWVQSECQEKTERLKPVYRLMEGPFREGGMTAQTIYRSEADTGEWREQSTRRKTGAMWREG